MEGRTDQWRAVLINGGPYNQCRAAVRPMQGRRTINGGPPYDQCRAAVRPMHGRRTTMEGRRTINAYDQCSAVLINAGPPY